MIELTAIATTILVLGLIALPRTTFLITWFFNSIAVGTVLGGSAIVFSIVGFFIFPRVMFAYFLLEAAASAPPTGSALYWIYISLAAMFDLTIKFKVTNQNED
jgi:hypothetical protein